MKSKTFSRQPRHCCHAMTAAIGRQRVATVLSSCIKTIRSYFGTFSWRGPRPFSGVHPRHLHRYTDRSGLSEVEEVQRSGWTAGPLYTRWPSTTCQPRCLPPSPARTPVPGDLLTHRRLDLIGQGLRALQCAAGRAFSCMRSQRGNSSAVRRTFPARSWTFSPRTSPSPKHRRGTGALSVNALPCPEKGASALAI